MLQTMTTAGEKGLWAWTIVVMLWLAARPAVAAEAQPIAAMGGVSAVGSGAGAGLLLDGRLRLHGGAQLGLSLSGQTLRVTYFGGHKAEGVLAGEAMLLGLLPLLRVDPVELDMRLASGIRTLRDHGQLETPYRHAHRSTTELACLAHVNLGSRYLLRAGAIIGLELETHPTAELADQLQLVTLGLGRAVTPSLMLYAHVDAGGTYGFDGDNGKTVLRGAFGLRVAFGGDALTGF
jgi:hypothetical protein